VHRARDDGVLAVDAERLGPRETSTRALGADSRDARKRPVERPVHDHEPPPAKRGERHLLGQPRSEPDDHLDRGLVGAYDRDRPAHREAHQQGPRRPDRPDRLAGVLDARIEASPRLDPVAELGEAKTGKTRREAVDQPFERGAPGAVDLGPLTAVDTDDGGAAPPAPCAQFAAGNYAAGVAAMPYLKEQLKADYLVPAARLAQSKSSDDFSATLKSIASPAGAWRLKKVQNTWSVVSFVGFQAGSERLEGRTIHSTGTYYGAYIALGIAWSQPFGGHKGYWGVDVSALDLGVLASNHANRNASDAGTKTSISTVLSPGISIYSNPGWFGPVTFGVGYVYRTPGLRTVTGPDGQQTKLDSSRIMLTVGIDVTVFKLNH